MITKRIIKIIKTESKLRTPKKGRYKSTITILTENKNKKLLRLLNKSIKSYDKTVIKYTKKYMRTINEEIKEMNKIINSTIIK